MKKSLVLAMAMALGVTASAYAANPFSDVPAGHWAYDSVNKLAAAGVVEGYPDGTYGGDKLMTRYEMAQIVAKAMAKGANVDKLAAEFADELDSLGVRVAALEKKSDNVKITGQIRYEYADGSGSKIGDGVQKNRLRTRLFVAGAINEDWTYGARLQNDQDLTNNEGDDTLKLNRAYVSGKLGGLGVVAGRQGMTLADGNIYDDTMDAVKASYGKDIKVTGYVAKVTEYADYDKAWGAAADLKLGSVALGGGYDAFNGEGTAEDNNIWNVGAKYKMGAVALGATYLHSDLDAEDHDGYVVALDYKGAKASAPGSYGLHAAYYDQGTGTFLNHTMNGKYGAFKENGFKGYKVAADYTFAKNIIGLVEYYDLEDKKTEETGRTLWTRLQFAF